MYKVGVCGVFGQGESLLNGQTIKTKTLTDQLKVHYNNESVKVLDTWRWKKNPFSLLFNCFRLVKDCENIIIMPAHNGVKVFPIIFLFFNIFYRRKLHYVIIGGWLPGLLAKEKKLIIRLNKFDKIYAETNVLYETLKNIGLENLEILPNFKKLEILDENHLTQQVNRPLKLCTFSKILEGKGIEDAIYAVKKINYKNENILCTLDIYGEIDNGYREKFNQIIKEFPEFICYKGKIDYSESVNILKHYYLLIFPTHFKTEGHPGTIIDAFSAGLPVVASKWNSADEIIDEGNTGFLYEFAEKEKLVNLLNQILLDYKKVTSMKINCINKAHEYSAQYVIEKFSRHLR